MRILFFLLTLTALAWSGIGNVGALKGSATIKRSNSTLEVSNGMALEVYDEIVTSAKSRVQVILEDNTVVTIGPNSTFIFDAYKFDGKDHSVVKMRIERGFFRSVTGMIGKVAPERFKVKTASATIGIRGTDFSALVTEQKETIACYKGAIDVFVKDALYLVDAGMMLDLVDGKVELMELRQGQSKAKSKKAGIKAVEEDNDDSNRVPMDEIADVVQQEMQSQIREDTPLDEPIVDFPDR